MLPLPRKSFLRQKFFEVKKLLVVTQKVSILVTAYCGKKTRRQEEKETKRVRTQEEVEK
jgi:hypothetical protein